MESSLYNGSISFNRLSGRPAGRKSSRARTKSLGINYSPEALEILKREGPKYQYGNGCLSDGVLGLWIARMCGLGDIIDKNKMESHLMSVYLYNLKTDLSDHVNPQRAGYAYGKEGGLILCSWPKGISPVCPLYTAMRFGQELNTRLLLISSSLAMSKKDLKLSGHAADDMMAASVIRLMNMNVVTGMEGLCRVTVLFRALRDLPMMP